MRSERQGTTPYREMSHTVHQSAEKHQKMGFVNLSNKPKTFKKHNYIFFHLMDIFLLLAFFLQRGN